MRNLILAVLALASALLPNVASARSEWVHVVGGKLSNSGPPLYFHPGRVNILITNLPAQWPVSAGHCRTLTHEDAPKVSFDFSDGLTTGAKLVASGYTLDGGKAVRGSFARRTYITLCRNAAGKPAAFAIQLSYYRLAPSGVLYGYGVYAENNGARGGKSSDHEGGILGGNASGGTATSNAVNTLQVGP